ncbi:MAG: Rieske 2Fe-2S domain-containing protein [Novosphingobium sp.]|nr:Rieske 2Fe-2S domain-containing protein [Novosphingobium sp.]
MATAADYGFGEFQFPRGWFMIGTAQDATETPVPVRFFGTDMVLYRGKSGKPRLVEAYCPHMGAHLAKNSTSYIVRDGEQVQGDSIRCPFHGWRFDENGQCDDIPYSDFIPKAACLKTYPLTERAGIIWTWHDPEGLEPDYPLPDFGGHYDEPGWVNWDMIHLGDLKIHGCEIVDNMADYGHMAPVHGSREGVYFANEFTDHVVHQYFGTTHRTAMTQNDDNILMLDTWRTGPGILESDMVGQYHGYWLIASTPIDEGVERMWTGIMVKAGDGIAPISDEQAAGAKAFAETGIHGLAQDVEIWDNKRPCINPMAIPADGPYPRLRIWYGQFFNPRDKAAAIQKRANGKTLTLDKREDMGVKSEMWLAGAQS